MSAMSGPQTCEISSTTRVSNRRVVWMTNSLGYGDELLYWGPILSAYVRAFPNSRFFVAADGPKQIPTSNHTVERLPAIRIPLGRRRFSYDRHLRFVSPSTIGKIARLAPDVLVISEFTMPSLFATRVRHRIGTPILLLVESDPLRGKPNRLGAMKQNLRHFIARRVDWALTNNRAGQRYIEHHLPIRHDRILCSPYVVSHSSTTRTADTTASPRAEFGDGDRLVFLYVGQLIERKGITQLIQGISGLTESQRQRCRFWLIGEGPERNAIERQISQHDLTNVVRVLGGRAYHELGVYYRDADVFVMPTLDDYRALVGFEAISYGLPLLHSRYDGAAEEIVDDDQNGFIYDPYDRDAFVDHVQHFMDLGENLQSFGEHSRRLSEGFTVDTAVKSLIDATNRCLQTR